MPPPAAVGWRSCLWLSLTYWGPLLLLRPFADIPLNDDWQYAYVVRGLLESGRLRLSDMSAPSVVALTALFLVNPLLFVLTPSFLTDVNALALALVAVALSCRGLGTRGGGLGWIFAGSLFSAAAYGVRQTGLMIPAGLTLFLWLRGRAALNGAEGGARAPVPA